jgi:creatinine amidohydrolase
VTSSLQFHELNRVQLASLAPSALVLLPVGATEQHGPHLPVGTDFLVVQHVAQAAASEAARKVPVLLAPTLPYGSSHHHLPFGGTLSLSTESFFKAALDLVVSLVRDGFRRVFLLNGHGGNDELLRLVARDASFQHEVDVATASYWTIASKELVQVGASAESAFPGHAGFFETSLLLALRPDLVTPERPERASVDRDVERSYLLSQHDAWLEIDGYTDSPAAADSSSGQRYLDAIVQSVAAALVDFYRTTERRSERR